MLAYDTMVLLHQRTILLQMQRTMPLIYIIYFHLNALKKFQNFPLYLHTSHPSLNILCFHLNALNLDDRLYKSLAFSCKLPPSLFSLKFRLS